MVITSIIILCAIAMAFYQLIQKLEHYYRKKFWPEIQYRRPLHIIYRKTPVWGCHKTAIPAVNDSKTPEIYSLSISYTVWILFSRQPALVSWIASPFSLIWKQIPVYTPLQCKRPIFLTLFIVLLHSNHFVYLSPNICIKAGYLFRFPALCQYRWKIFNYSFP